MSEPAKAVGAIFDAAIELPPERRAAYVQEACGGDEALRQRVEALLRAHESAGTFMDNLAVGARTGSAGRQAGGTAGRPDWALQTAATNRRRRLRRGLYGRAGGTGAPPGGAQGHQAGHGHQEVIARFEAERQALALMDHPNIAKVLDAGATDTGRPYFVMELVRGRQDHRLLRPEQSLHP